MTEQTQPSGLKFEKGKCRMDLLPVDALREVGWVLTANLEENGGKYPERNWEQGAEWHRYYGAIRRHLGKFWSGEDFDQDPEGSHLAHLSHVACLSLMLLAHWMRAIGVDDRPEEFDGNLDGPLTEAQKIGQEIWEAMGRASLARAEDHGPSLMEQFFSDT